MQDELGNRVHRKTWAGIVVGLGLAFAAGWLVAQMRNVHKIPRAQVAETKWTTSIEMLVHNAVDLQLTDPDTIQALVGSSADGQSIVLAYLYDSMTPYQKKSLVLWIPAARRIALAQQAPGLLHDRKHLLIFADCLQELQADGGSMRKCVESHKGWGMNGSARH